MNERRNDSEPHDHTPFNWFAECNNGRLVDEMKRRFAWYSAEHAEAFGTALWRTPEGKTVEATAVYDRTGHSRYGWKDAVFIGEVVECVRGIEGGKISFGSFEYPIPPRRYGI